MNNLLNHLNEDAQSLNHNDSAHCSVFNTLIYTVFQQPRERDASGTVLAISSANPCEGVTYIARALVKDLAKCDITSVAGISTRFLRKLHEPTIEAIRESLIISTPCLSGDSLKTKKTENSQVTQEGSGSWEGSWKYRQDGINLLRGEFDHTIIDCPSLKESGDLLSVAPFVDGVILVIEANRTRREELRQAEQKIIAARGKLLGYALNKRTYEVPGWLFRKL